MSKARYFQLTRVENIEGTFKSAFYVIINATWINFTSAPIAPATPSIQDAGIGC